MGFKAKFKRFPVIKTERLILRQVRLEDVQDYYNMTSDPEVARYYDWDGPETVKVAKRILDNDIKKYNKKKAIKWAITLKNKDVLIGTVFFFRFVCQSRAEVAVNLSRKYWGKGIITEAMEAVVAFGFEKMGLHRIEALVNPNNIGAIRTLEKAGFEREGVLRKYSPHLSRKKFLNVAMYAILKEDYIKLYTLGH